MDLKINRLAQPLRLTAYPLLVRHPVRLISIRSLPPPQVRIVLLEVPLGPKKVPRAQGEPRRSLIGATVRDILGRG